MSVSRQPQATGASNHNAPVAGLAQTEAGLNSRLQQSQQAINANAFARTREQGRKPAGADTGAGDPGFIEGIHPDRIRNGSIRNGMTVPGQNITVTNLDAYLNNPSRPTAGRGSFNVISSDKMDNWFQSRIDAANATTARNNAEYQRQVAAAQANNRGGLASFVHGMQQMRKANRTETREDNQAHEVQLQQMANEGTLQRQQLSGEGGSNRVYDYTSDVMAVLSSETKDAMGNVTGIAIDPDKAASYNYLRTLSGVTDDRALAPVWQEAYLQGVNMQHLVELMQNRNNPTVVENFKALYKYLPSYLNQ